MGYTWLNPHLTLTVDWFRETVGIDATTPQWPKWKPSDPTSPHWYDADSLGRLIAAYLSHDMDTSRERTVREFVSEFRGLSRSGRQKAVLEATGLARQPLAALVENGNVNRDLASSLLEAMKYQSAPVKPKALGEIGEEHLAACFKNYGCDSNSFRYKRVFSTDPLPAVYEFAFGHCPEGARRWIVAGVNWSPGIVNPFRTVGWGQSLDGILQEAWAGPNESIIIFVHVASPVAGYLDRGKSSVGGVLKGDILTAGVQHVTKEWTKQRKAEQRQASARSRRSTMWKPQVWKFTEACERCLPAAYQLASGNGQYPANARQVYYAFRGPAQELVGKPLDASYFTQTLLPDYRKNHPELDWDVAYDDRGHLTEPHSDKRIGLGTLSVREYNRQSQDLEIKGLMEHREMVRAEGPEMAYGAFLFIEKEGFMSLLSQMGVAERYDLAIVSTKGMSVTAARELFDHVCHTYNIPLLALRDFDRAGFKIVSTLERDTKRYQHHHQIRVIDLGLRLADVRQYDLQTEAVTERIDVRKQKSGLRKDGASEEEISFLIDGQQRVELNAFTSGQFAEWLEGNLQSLREQGVIQKAIPDADTLERVYRANVAAAYFEERAQEAARESWEQAEQSSVPSELEQAVSSKLVGDPSLAWWEAVKQITKE